MNPFMAPWSVAKKSAADKPQVNESGYMGQSIHPATTLSIEKRINWFEAYLPEGGTVLDLGGDTLKPDFFLGKSLEVVSLGLSTDSELFKDLDPMGKSMLLQTRLQTIIKGRFFDGVWAPLLFSYFSASDLQLVLEKLAFSVRPGGVLYLTLSESAASFPDNSPIQIGQLVRLLAPVQELKLIRSWSSGRSHLATDDSTGEKYLHAIFRADAQSLGKQAGLS